MFLPRWMFVISARRRGKNVELSDLSHDRSPRVNKGVLPQAVRTQATIKGRQRGNYLQGRISAILPGRSPMAEISDLCSSSQASISGILLPSLHSRSLYSTSLLSAVVAANSAKESEMSQFETNTVICETLESEL